MEEQTLLLEDPPILPKADGPRGISMVRMLALTAILAVAGVCVATTQETTLSPLVAKTSPKLSETIEMASVVPSIKVDAKLLKAGLEIYKQLKQDMDKFFGLGEFAHQLEGMETLMVKMHDYLKPKERKAYQKLAKARLSALKAVPQAQLVTKTIHDQAKLLQLILEQEGQETEKVRTACAIFVKAAKITEKNVKIAMGGLVIAMNDILEAENALDLLVGAMERFRSDLDTKEAIAKTQARSTCSQNGVWGLLAGPIGLVVGETIAKISCESSWIPKLKAEFNARKAEVGSYKNKFKAKKEVLTGLDKDIGKRITKLTAVQAEYRTVRLVAEEVVQGLDMLFKPLLQSVKELVSMTA